MAKKTKRRNNRLSKRYSKKRLSKKLSKKRYSKKLSKKRYSKKKRVSRKMKGGMEATSLSEGTDDQVKEAAAFGLTVPEYLELTKAQMEDPDRKQRRDAGGVPVGEWKCQACTFLNVAKSTSCDICGTPRDARPPEQLHALEPEPELQPDIEYQTRPEEAHDKHLVYITGVCFWGESENIDKIVSDTFLKNILKQLGYRKDDVYFVFIDPGESITGGSASDCSRVEERVRYLIQQDYHTESQIGKYFRGSQEFSNQREGRYNNFAIIMSGIFSYELDGTTHIASLLTDSENGKLQIISGDPPGIILEQDVTHYIPLSMYQDVGPLHACHFFKNEDGNITHFFEQITKLRRGRDSMPRNEDVAKIDRKSYIYHYYFYDYIRKSRAGELCEYMTELLHPVRAPPEGTKLGIMRHSFRLDNELSNVPRISERDQKYWIDGFNYNTPLANDQNIDPQVPGFSLKTKANDRILESIERGLYKHDFKCIITSPFTRCLQTAEVVRIMLGIRPEDIFINYNLREADSALEQRKYVPIKYIVPGPEWNTPEPYNQGLIAEIAKGGIEPYVKQTVDNIFNKYKHLGNVLFITHGDVYNEYAPKIPETDIGASSLEEAGWVIFEPPSNMIVANAGEGFVNVL
jgi:broad specificity phosphatase PhoE